MCILLVEDEVLIRFILAEALAQEGFEVREAADGDQASALIAETPDGFSLLVTDIYMPGRLDGVGVARLFRARHPGVPVIYTTGRGVLLNGVGSLGDKDVLIRKPFAPTELLAVVRRLLGVGGDDVR